MIFYRFEVRFDLLKWLKQQAMLWSRAKALCIALLKSMISCMCLGLSAQNSSWDHGPLELCGYHWPCDFCIYLSRLFSSLCGGFQLSLFPYGKYDKYMRLTLWEEAVHSNRMAEAWQKQSINFSWSLLLFSPLPTDNTMNWVGCLVLNGPFFMLQFRAQHSVQPPDMISWKCCRYLVSAKSLLLKSCKAIKSSAFIFQQFVVRLAVFKLVSSLLSYEEKAGNH